MINARIETLEDKTFKQSLEKEDASSLSTAFMNGRPQEKEKPYRIIGRTW